MKEELIHVPLLWRSPSAKAGRCKTPISHVDIAPTLLAAMGVPVPGEFAGRSRWQALQRGEAWAQPVVVDSAECINPNVVHTRLAPRIVCVREERYKMIIRSKMQSAELFDLESDPEEHHPIPEGREDETRRRLLRHAREHVASMQSRDQRPRLHARLKDIRVEMENSDFSAGEVRRVLRWRPGAMDVRSLSPLDGSGGRDRVRVPHFGKGPVSPTASDKSSLEIVYGDGPSSPGSPVRRACVVARPSEQIEAFRGRSYS